MELQENGLPIGAEFVAILQPKKGQYFMNEGDVEMATIDWSFSARIIIRFPTYGKPLSRVDLKSQKLRGGSMATAYMLPNKDDWYIAIGGTINQATCDWWSTDMYGPRICLETPLKKHKVLVLPPLKINANGSVNLRYGVGERDCDCFDAEKMCRVAGGTIKEVEDVE